MRPYNSFDFRDTSDQGYLAVSLNARLLDKADEHLLFPGCAYQCRCSVPFQLELPTELGNSKDFSRKQCHGRQGMDNTIGYLLLTLTNDDFTDLLSLFRDNRGFQVDQVPSVQYFE